MFSKIVHRNHLSKAFKSTIFKKKRCGNRLQPYRNRLLVENFQNFYTLVDDNRLRSRGNLPPINRKFLTKQQPCKAW